MSAYGLTRDQNVELLVRTALEYGVTDRRQIAYIVATAQHETDNFATSREYDGPNQAIRNGYGGGENYYGRGYVQVTHDRNYDRMATTLGDPRIRTNPDIVAQEATLGAQTTVVGMSRGLYTGVGLDRYINPQNADYTDARAVVNGTDRAAHIAGLARTWEQNLPDIIDRVTAQGITPRAMPGSPMADGALSVNERGPEVARMQEALRQRGFELTPDGLYGNGTRGIVEQYQRQNGLPATGTADRETLSSLGVTQIVPLPNAATPTAPTSPPPANVPPVSPETPPTNAQPNPANPATPSTPPANVPPASPETSPANAQPNPANPAAPANPAPDRPQAPPTTNGQVSQPTQNDRPLMSNPNHPDHKLYQQAVSNLEQLGPSGGFKSREDLEKAAASLAADAKATGLNEIDHISKTSGPNGQSYLVAVQGDPTSPAAKNAYIDYNQATSQTVAQSTAMSDAQKPAAAQPTEQQQEPNRIAMGAR
ncbi:MAG: XVIPCD domain-containing protein [Pseudomonadota bacterium]